MPIPPPPDAGPSSGGDAEEMHIRTALFVPALVAVGLVSLTGCSAVDSILHKQSTSTFDDVGAFRDGTELDASWAPADSTAITARTSTVDAASDAVILLTSSSSLPGECVEVERSSAPAWVLDDAPDPYKAEAVFACGEWSVISADDGWYGWTPNSEAERTAAAG